VGIQKYALVGGSWSLKGTISAASVRGLTGVVSGSNVTLYATTGGSTGSGGGTLWTVADTAGYNAAPGTTTPTTLATTAGSEAFRGVAFAPLGATATTLVSSVNPSTFNQSVVFTVTVSGPGGTPGGTVTVQDGAATLGTITLSGGTGSLTLSGLGGGTHSLTAVYGGDANYLGGSSAVLTQTVNPAASTTVLASSPDPSAVGQTVTFTATVTGPGATPTGTVTFNEGNTVLATGSLAAGGATFSTAALAAGSHGITAVYGGDANFAASTSAVLTQDVFAPPTVSAAVVNEDNAALAGAQRSMVNSVVLHFDHAVTFDAGAVSIALHPNVTVNGVAQPGGVGTVPTLAYSTPDGGLTYVVTFSGSGVTNGSIADGVYDLSVDHTKVHDAVGQTMAADYVFTFFRLFGDSNGDKRVNNTDLNKLSGTFGLSEGSAGYLAYFDFNGDNRINNTDLNQFAARFGTAYGGF
jgi:hypothetical protein